MDMVYKRRNITFNLKSNDKQATFTYSLLGKAFEKQTKTIKGQGKKQTEAIKEHEKLLANTNAL